jgi:hypothetical protein
VVAATCCAATVVSDSPQEHNAAPQINTNEASNARSMDAPPFQFEDCPARSVWKQRFGPAGPLERVRFNDRRRREASGELYRLMHRLLGPAALVDQSC